MWILSIQFNSGVAHLNPRVLIGCRISRHSLPQRTKWHKIDTLTISKHPRRVAQHNATTKINLAATRGGYLLISESKSQPHGFWASRQDTVLPIARLVATQLLAYHVARLCGTDMISTANLAKSVTVE